MQQNFNSTPKRPPKPPPKPPDAGVRSSFSEPLKSEQSVNSSLPQKTNTLALVSLITGIASALMLLLSLCVPCLGVVPLLIGAIAAVLGFLSKRQIDQSQGMESGRGMAVAGMITGLVVAVIALVFLVISVFVVGFAGLMEFF